MDNTQSIHALSEQYLSANAQTQQKPLAILYSRFSSKQQTGNDSIDRQLDGALRFCAQHNLQLSEANYSDLGISAYADKSREGLEMLLDAVKSGTIPSDSWILCHTTCRLSRKGFNHVLKLVEELVSTGCKFCTINDNHIYDATNIKSLWSAMPLMMSAELAFEESSKKSMMVKSGKEALRKKRLLRGKQPYWITLQGDVPELNSFSVLVKLMVDLRLKGYSAQRIAKQLNADGHLSPTGKSWGAAAIRTTIDNPAMWGAKQYSEVKEQKLVPVEIVEDMYPAICSKSIWLQIKYEKGVKEVGRRSKSSPFSKLLRCALCGAAMTTRSTYQKGTKYDYRVCIRSTEGSCDQKSRFRALDNIILGELKHLKYEVKTHATVEVDGIKVLQDKLTLLNQTKELLQSNPTALAAIYADIAQTEQELHEEKRKKEVLEAQPDEVNFQSIVDLEDNSQRNVLLRRIIEAIEVKRIDNEKRVSQVRVVVRFKNGHTQSFVICYLPRTHQIKWTSDTEKHKAELNAFVNEAINELNDWEMDLNN
ncbi:recombinase family protein [Vibrio cholerae]